MALAGIERVSTLSRGCVDAGYLPKIPSQGNRFWWMPLPGLPAYGRCERDRSGLPLQSLAWAAGDSSHCGSGAHTDLETLRCTRRSNSDKERSMTMGGTGTQYRCEMRRPIGLESGFNGRPVME